MQGVNGSQISNLHRQTLTPTSLLQIKETANDKDTIEILFCTKIFSYKIINGVSLLINEDRKFVKRGSDLRF